MDVIAYILAKNYARSAIDDAIAHALPVIELSGSTSKLTQEQLDLIKGTDSGIIARDDFIFRYVKSEEPNLIYQASAQNPITKAITVKELEINSSTGNIVERTIIDPSAQQEHLESIDENLENVWIAIQDIIKKSVRFIISEDAETTPEGVTWVDKQGHTIVGTLEASEDNVGKVYLVPDTTSTGKSIYSEYVSADKEVAGEHVYRWEKIGDTDITIDNLGKLAYVDDATGEFVISTIDSLSYINGTANVSANYTPAGSVSSSFSGNQLTSTGHYTPEGSVSSSFTGNELTSTGATTAKGTVSRPTITVTPTTTTNKASKLKTAGSSDTGTAASYTQGNFSGGSFDQGTDVFVKPTLTTRLDTDDTLVIEFTQGSFTQGEDEFTPATHANDVFVQNVPTEVVLPTFDPVTLITDVTAALDADPVFTGQSVNISVKGTPSGSVSSGFTGSEATLSVKGTPSGSVSSSFTGTAATIESTGTSAGTIDITRTDKTIEVTVYPEEEEGN